MTKKLPKAAEARLAGRYRYVRELGRGGSGRVVLVLDEATSDTPRALKVVSGADAERLAWEREVLGRVDHPHVARVFALLRLEHAVPRPFALSAGSVVLVEEHVAGATADEALAAAAPAERARLALAIGLAASRGLAAIHALGFVHGDVKPKNLLTAASHGLATKLVDLGLARPFGWAADAGGTPRYMAPEAFAGERSVATDLYALGVTLLDLLAGVGAPAGALTTDEPRWWTHGGPSGGAAALVRLEEAGVLARMPCGDEVHALLAALVSDDPQGRPHSARAVAARLGLCLGEGAERAAAPSVRERVGALSALPAVGLDAARGRLLAALEEGGLVIVCGRAGSGRDRLVREALRIHEIRRVTSRAAPVAVRELRALPDEPVNASIGVLRDADSVDLAAARAYVDAQRLGRDGPQTLLLLRSEGSSAADASIELSPLSDEDLERLATEALGRAPSPRALRALRRVSGGLAGRAVEAMIAAARAELDWERQGAFDDLPRESVALPQLPPPARALAETLAVAGGTLTATPGHAEGVPDLVASGLATLEAQGLCLRPDVVRALFAELDPAHAAARARALLEHSPVGAARAFAAAAAGRAGEAAASLLGAIDAARVEGDAAAAVALARLGQERGLGGGLELALAHADALRALTRYAEAAELLAPFADGAARLAAGRLARLMGLERGAVERALAGAGEGDGPTAAGAALVRARLAFDAGEPESARSRARDIFGRASDEGWTGIAAEACELLSMVESPAEARRWAERGLTYARGPRARRRRARLLSALSAVRAREGAAEESLALAREAVEEARRAGELHETASFLVNLGAREWERGRPGPALAALLEGARRLRRIGRRRDLSRALYDLSAVALAIGDGALAADSAARAAGDAEQAGDPDAQALSLLVLAELALRRGELGAALREAGDAARVAARASQGTRQVTLARAAVIACAAEHTEQARVFLTGAADPPPPDEPVARCELSRARAKLALLEGRLEEAATCAAAAEHAALESGSYECALLAALLRAEVARGDGDGAEFSAALATARTLLDRALATLDAPARARLRSVPAYAQALSTAPRADESPDPSDGRFRRAAREVAAAEAPEDVSRALLDGALSLSGAERGVYLEVTREGEIKPRSSRGFAGHSLESAFSQSIVTRALDRGRAVSSALAPDAAFLGDAPSVHRLSLRSLLCVPVIAEGRAYGALYLDDRLRPRAFGARLVDELTDLGVLAGLALGHLYRLERERRARAHIEALECRLAQQVEGLAYEVAELRSERDDDWITESAVMRALRLEVEKLAALDLPVLVTGESGAGKERVARGLHALGPRRSSPFVTENCAAIPEGLLESTLFGHVRGAFTGADRDRVGLFEAAQGGTLLLDEIAEMSPALQAKLLRVVQEGEVRPVGSSETRSVDVRLVCATHADLEARVAAGSFRRDLYYRIAVAELRVPPLRERPEDLPRLAARLLETVAPGRRLTLEPAALAALLAAPWPGNVRQLENELTRATLMADDVIRLEHLSFTHTGDVAARPPEVGGELSLRHHVDALERRLIRAALARVGGNKTRAAELLGVSRYGLSKMRKRLGLDEASD